MTTIKRFCVDIQHDRDVLASRCRNLSDHLLKIAASLESDKPHCHLRINPKGVIQSSGTIIDAECGWLMGRIDILGIVCEATEMEPV